MEVLPNPVALEYFHKHQPSALQIIDQPLHSYPFLKAIYENGFYLRSLETYSVFFREADYQSLILKPYIPVEKMNEKKKFEVLRKSLWLRLQNLFS